jgi:Na+(H+)/acetate symporter ActP
MPLAEDLAVTVKSYVSAWLRMSRVYALVSIVLRFGLIIASAVLASKLLGIDWSKDSDRGAWLSVLVGIGTAIDSWLKPRDKWKGFMTVRERAQDLLMRLRNTDPADASKIDQLREEFQEILEAHREKNVY